MNLQSILSGLGISEDTNALSEMAQRQLHVGALALEDTSTEALTAAARELFELREKVFADAAAPDELLKIYDLNDACVRLAFACACLPAPQRDHVLHNVFKGMCIWIGHARLWEESTPATILVAGCSRLRTDDNSLAVIQQAEKALRDTNCSEDTITEYRAGLRQILLAAFAEARSQLNLVTGMLGAIRQADDEREEEKRELAASGPHPLVGRKVVLGEVPHPLHKLVGETGVIREWAHNLEDNTTTDALLDEYSMRIRLYDLPDDNNVVCINVLTGQLTGEDILVHTTEIAEVSDGIADALEPTPRVGSEEV